MRTFCGTILATSVVIAAIAAQGADLRHDGWFDFNKNGIKDVYEDSSASVEARVADLLSQMTLEEKTCQLATLYGSGRVLKDAQPTPEWKNEVWKDGIGNIDEELNGVGKMFEEHPEYMTPYSNHVAAINAIQCWFIEETRLGIPVDFSNEGIHGLNHTGATPLPAPIAIGSTWNRALVRRAGEIVGEEARLIGYSNVYAPILDVARDQRWGRTLECYGEDPFLVAELGKEMALGIQSQGVASTLKHYAAYGVPKGGRDGDCRTDPHITPRELHEIFLYPFKRVIREARPMGVMCSYNDWNGEPVAASKWFLADLLRGEYGFDGYVVSDSEAVEFVHTKHAVAETYEEACAKILEAGLNVRTHFTPPEDFILPVRAAVKSGRLAMSVVDQRVAEVLAVKFRLGLFDNPYLGDAANADAKAGAEKHRDFADAIQAESLVLLKNDGVLPLAKGSYRKILVAGPLADETNFMVSRYGPNGFNSLPIRRAIADYLGADAEVRFVKGCATADAQWPESEIYTTPLTKEESDGIDAAVAAARESDIVIAVVGEDAFATGESRSRTSLDLPGRQRLLVEHLFETGKPVVVILVNGQPLTVAWMDRRANAILETWFAGPFGGAAVAKALFGEINPSGKTTVTFPKSIGQIQYNFPFKKGSHGGQPKFGPNGFGYTRVTGALYPFGHGLSYTTFAYSNLTVESADTASGVSWNVSCRVTNTGARRGAEVVQLYVRDKYSSVVTYDSVLRGFEKVELEPGESKRIDFVLTPDDLAILDKNMKWTVEPGEFEIMVGSSSAASGGQVVCGSLCVAAALTNAEETGVRPIGARTREEIVSFFTDNEFGRRPAAAEKLSLLKFEKASADKPMKGMVRKQARIVYGGPYATNSFVATAFVPAEAKTPVPAVLLICTRNYEDNCDPERVKKSPFFPVEEIVARGFAAVSFFAGDVAPDYNTGNTKGVFEAFEKPGPYRNCQLWGTLSAWAWGASRIMDWLETVSEIDATKVALVGHSRGGKTALWAAVTDERFAFACVNGSGCGGAKLNHADIPKSEHIAEIVRTFQYWFCLDYTLWANRDGEIPFDQHELLACVAPRLLAVGSGSEDPWAGPEGERKATELARAAWRDPARVSYHVHPGKHDLGEYDWNVYLTHAERYWKTN